MLSLKLIAVVCVGAVGAIGAVVNALWGPRARARRRLAAGSCAIADHAIVTLTGTVRAIGEPLVAPLSGRRCVLHSSLGRVFEDTAHNRLFIAIDERVMRPFELETRDGKVLVDGIEAELAIPRSPLIPRRLEREIEFLEAHNQPRSYLRYTVFEELVVASGDRIAVQGMAVVEADRSEAAERGYRDDAPIRIRLIAHADHPLTIGRAR